MKLKVVNICVIGKKNVIYVFCECCSFDLVCFWLYKYLKEEFKLYDIINVSVKKEVGRCFNVKKEREDGVFYYVFYN